MKTYPEIDFKIAMFDNQYVVKINTLLRMKHTDGVWYKTEVLEYARIDDLQRLSQIINRFTESVYMLSLFGVVNTETTYAGLPKDKLFNIDDDQREEAERLKFNL